jgi:hypothetical protein
MVIMVAIPSSAMAGAWSWRSELQGALGRDADDDHARDHRGDHLEVVADEVTC